MAVPNGDRDGRSEWWSGLTPADKEFLQVWVQTLVRNTIFDLVPRLIDDGLAARLGAGVQDALLDLDPPPGRARWPRPISKHIGVKHIRQKTGTRGQPGGGSERR